LRKRILASASIGETGGSARSFWAGLIIATVVLLSARASAAARLLDLGFLPGQSTFSVMSVDLQNGAYTALLPSVSPNAAGGSVAFDPLGQRLFFFNSSTSEIFTVHLSSGIVTHVSVPSCCGTLEYDSVRGRLLDLGWLPGQTVFSIFSVDPDTGHYTPIVSPLPPAAISNNSVTYDPISDRFFFLDQSTSELLTVSLQTGLVSRVSVPTCCGLLKYDVVGRRLLDLGFLPGQAVFSVFSINPATGAYTPIVGPIPATVASSQLAYDASGQRLFFWDSERFELFTVNLQNAQVSHVSVPACCGSLVFDPLIDVPTLGNAGLIALALTLIAIALISIRPIRAF
jgi:Fe2+ transport system protein FeoA